MKNILLGVLIATIVVLLLLLCKRQPQQFVNDSRIDSLKHAARVHQALSDQYRVAMDSAMRKVDELALRLIVAQQETDSLQDSHHARITALRNQPPDTVLTTSLVMAECDSCMEVGARILKQNEIQTMKIIGLEEAVTACQTSNAHLDTLSTAQTGTIQVLEQENLQLQRKVKNRNLIIGGLVLLKVGIMIFSN